MSIPHPPHRPHLGGIDWMGVEDEKDLEVWNRLNSSFWSPEDVPLSGDLESWNTLTALERQLTTRVFAGLTLLEGVHSALGALGMVAGAATSHEEAVYTAIAFMEGVHARSYSAVFSTLCSPAEADDAVRWSIRNESANQTSAIVTRYYRGDEPLMRKVVNVMLESFVLHAGFYLPLHLVGQGKLANTANLVRLIIRDEAVHGDYIGHKFQRGLARANRCTRDAVREQTIELLAELYANQVQYAHDLYAPVGLCEEVEKYLLHNANQALLHLGYEPMADSTVIALNPGILAPPCEPVGPHRPTA